jgi:hypothetical protein
MTTTKEPKPGFKSTEFWATVGIGGLPIAEQFGWFDKMPLTQGGETALWFSAGLITSVYVISRAWVKVSTVKYGEKDEKDSSTSSSSGR